MSLEAPRTHWSCPYCGRTLPDARAACCGEVGHAIEVDEEGDPVLEDEDEEARL